MGTYMVETSLAERVNEKLREIRCSKQELALHIEENRSTVSNYLNYKQEKIAKGKVIELEDKLERFLAEVGTTNDTQIQPPMRKPSMKKAEVFESRDFKGVIGLCTVCQENHGLGIITGKSGYGKTFSLKYYAKLPRVVLIECNEAMNCKDIVRKIERFIGLPLVYGSIDERMGHITNFFNENQGYLLIVDEADKLITKNTQKKIEMIRYIADGARVGIVIAGEPALESAIKAYDPRFANRMDFYYKLRGLGKEEIKRYFTGYEVDEAAMEEFCTRACNTHTGCFRLFDRTLNNVLRILINHDNGRITLDVIKEASSMMML